MHTPACLAVAAVLFLPSSLSAQMTWQPTPRPVVTAENERWYQEGEPITFAGHFYYPAGAHVFFSGYEMVRTGDYRGIPLYSKTTIEPYSMIFVPLAGGLMQPYERRREGDLAGTAGSTAPSFPIDRTPTPESPMGAAPPYIETWTPTDVAPPQPLPEPTAGNIVPRPVSPGPPVPVPRRSTATDSIFIQFRAQRWFASGSGIEFDPARFTRVGEYGGLPVFVREGEDLKSIYVPVTRTTPGVLARYSRE